MEIGLQDGSSRVFAPGEHFFSADLLPAGAAFDPKVHGHWSRQLGPDPLVTLFLRGVEIALKAIKNVHGTHARAARRGDRRRPLARGHGDARPSRCCARSSASAARSCARR